MDMAEYDPKVPVIFHNRLPIKTQKDPCAISVRISYVCNNMVREIRLDENINVGSQKKN